MGKTPKRAAPGGDERNLYVRRLKATNAPSRSSESSLPEGQRASEISNRPKLTGIQKKIPPGPGKNFKSKLRPPTKVEQHQSVKQLKVLLKNTEAKSADMQPGSEESEVKLNVSIQKENIAEENSNNKTVEGDKSAVNKEHIDNSPEQMSSEIQPSLKTIQEVVPVENKTVFKEKEGFFLGCVNSETKEIEDQDGNDIKLIYEVEPSSLNNGEKILEMQPKDKNKEPQEELPPIQDEMKNGINEKEELLTEIQTVNESYSVEIVESTTSEIPEIPVSVTQSNIQKDKENDDINDASFVSYDSAIMLKDVQIRLNDCLKDNSKLYDESNMEDVQSQLLKDLSFGKTLRNISGRHSIGRMRHVTLREKRISPNSSLFVNTSTMSVPQDEGGDSKVLHYGSGLLSDSFSTNGSPLDRKRKIETENWNSAKKQKTDGESNIFNTSLNLWKNLRIPSMQVSTPKAAPCNFESTKLNISGIKNDDNKNATEPTESTKKWCVIM